MGIQTAPTCRIGINSWNPFWMYDVLFDPWKCKMERKKAETKNPITISIDILLWWKWIVQQTSKKMFVMRLFVWISGSLVVVLVNLSLYNVATPLKCQQNMFVNLKIIKQKMNICSSENSKRRNVSLTVADNRTH